MATRPSAIQARQLVKRFGDFTAVDGVSFEVAQGDLFGLLGPNGAGKTTLTRMLTTLIVPTAGEASVAGYDVARAPDLVRQAIGVIPQALTSDLDLTGGLPPWSRCATRRTGKAARYCASILPRGARSRGISRPSALGRTGPRSKGLQSRTGVFACLPTGLR